MIMRSLVCLFFIFTFVNCFSQDVTKLSKDNGYQHFKYNTAPTDYYDIERWEHDAGKLALYVYEGDKNFTFGGFDPSGIFLFFKENKSLIKIEVQFQFDGKESYEKVLDDLEGIYGPSEEFVLTAALYDAEEFRSWEDGDHDLDIILTKDFKVIVRFSYNKY